jgi:hypothetical protein
MTEPTGASASPSFTAAARVASTTTPAGRPWEYTMADVSPVRCR